MLLCLLIVYLLIPFGATTSGDEKETAIPESMATKSEPEDLTEASPSSSQTKESYYSLFEPLAVHQEEHEQTVSPSEPFSLFSHWHPWNANFMASNQGPYEVPADQPSGKEMEQIPKKTMKNEELGLLQHFYSGTTPQVVGKNVEKPYAEVLQTATIKRGEIQQEKQPSAIGNLPKGSASIVQGSSVGSPPKGHQHHSIPARQQPQTSRGGGGTKVKGSSTAHQGQLPMQVVHVDEDTNEVIHTRGTPLGNPFQALKLEKTKGTTPYQAHETGSKSAINEADQPERERQLERERAAEKERLAEAEQEEKESEKELALAKREAEKTLQKQADMEVEKQRQKLRHFMKERGAFMLSTEKQGVSAKEAVQEAKNLADVIEQQYKHRETIEKREEETLKKMKQKSEALQRELAELEHGENKNKREIALKKNELKKLTLKFAFAGTNVGEENEFSNELTINAIEEILGKSKEMEALINDKNSENDETRLKKLRILYNLIFSMIDNFWIKFGGAQRKASVFIGHVIFEMAKIYANTEKYLEDQRRKFSTIGNIETDAMRKCLPILVENAKENNAKNEPFKSIDRLHEKIAKLEKAIQDYHRENQRMATTDEKTRDAINQKYFKKQLQRIFNEELSNDLRQTIGLIRLAMMVGKANLNRVRVFHDTKELFIWLPNRIEQLKEIRQILCQYFKIEDDLLEKRIRANFNEYLKRDILAKVNHDPNIFARIIAFIENKKNKNPYKYIEIDMGNGYDVSNLRDAVKRTDILLQSGDSRTDWMKLFGEIREFFLCVNMLVALKKIANRSELEINVDDHRKFWHIVYKDNFERITNEWNIWKGTKEKEKEAPKATTPAKSKKKKTQRMKGGQVKLTITEDKEHVEKGEQQSPIGMEQGQKIEGNKKLTFSDRMELVKYVARQIMTKNAGISNTLKSIDTFLGRDEWNFAELVYQVTLDCDSMDCEEEEGKGTKKVESSKDGEDEEEIQEQQNEEEQKRMLKGKQVQD